MRLFDTYLAVDWSARNGPSPARPSRDALWVGEGSRSDGDEAPRVDTVTYWRTRRACVEHLRQRLLHHTALGRRVCVGFDFAFGYPSGFAVAMGLAATPPWRGLWAEVASLLVDDDDNRNNRFAVAAALNQRCGGAASGPLWGCPSGGAGPHLLPTSPGFPYTVRPGLTLGRLRWTEQRAPGAQPVWKLYGPGSVGGQTLTGIPAIGRLRADPTLAPLSRVWPVETGFTDTPLPRQGPAIVYAEIWPSLAPTRVDDGAIRDAAQVRAMVRWLATTDHVGQLGQWFAPPAGLSPAALAACVLQEGWILGAGFNA